MSPKVGEIWSLTLSGITPIIFTEIGSRSNIYHYKNLLDGKRDWCKNHWFNPEYRMKYYGKHNLPINLTTNLSKLIYIGE